MDSFQGKQLDVIILSCVRASDRKCVLSPIAHSFTAFTYKEQRAQ